MWVSDKSIKVNLPHRQENLLEYLGYAVERQLDSGETPVRFVVVQSDEQGYHCEVTVAAQMGYHQHMPPSIFQFRKRQYENNSQFNAVMLIPTGINCEIGGHAGDATPAARLLAALCDNLIIHPNVVNASDINELTENCVVVEGSVLSRLLMGTVGLQKVRANRVLVILEDIDKPTITDAAINSVSAARATLGLNCTRIVCVKKPCNATIDFAASGRASGRITSMDTMIEVLDEYADTYDAVAILTVLGSVKSQEHLMHDYYVENNTNPWGGIEAMLTHTISFLLDKPSMHAPIMECDDPVHFGRIDPRKASEVVSRTYMHCVLKGIHRSPKIMTDPTIFGKAGILSAEDIHCLVIPEGVLGLPTLAALEQGIPVIAVRENHNLMHNKLESLPFAAGKYFIVNNYLEAAGLMGALKAGVEPSAIQRPIPDTRICEDKREVVKEVVS